MAEILIIEDEPEVRELVRLGLERDGHSIRETGNATDVIDALAGVDIVILDLVLPEFDGMEVLREIRAYDPDIPIVVLSALVTSRDKVEALDSGAFDYVTKPFEVEELQARIRVAVRVRETQVLDRTLLDELEAERAIDPVTGLLNRRAMMVRLTEECFRNERGLGPSSIALIDIDDLGELNAEIGIDAGDRAVVEIARLLKVACRRSDVVFRIGGEEFLLLLAGTSVEGGLRAAERVATSVRRSPVAGERCVSVSAGVTEFRPDDDLDSLLSRARSALDYARSIGRGRVAVAP